MVIHKLSGFQPKLNLQFGTHTGGIGGSDGMSGSKASSNAPAAASTDLFTPSATSPQTELERQVKRYQENIDCVLNDPEVQQSLQAVGKVVKQAFADKSETRTSKLTLSEQGTLQTVESVQPAPSQALKEKVGQFADHAFGTKEGQRDLLTSIMAQKFAAANAAFPTKEEFKKDFQSAKETPAQSDLLLYFQWLFEQQLEKPGRSIIPEPPPKQEVPSFFEKPVPGWGSPSRSRGHFLA